MFSPLCERANPLTLASHWIGRLLLHVHTDSAVIPSLSSPLLFAFCSSTSPFFNLTLHSSSIFTYDDIHAYPGYLTILGLIGRSLNRLFSSFITTTSCRSGRCARLLLQYAWYPTHESDQGRWHRHSKSDRPGL